MMFKHKIFNLLSCVTFFMIIEGLSCVSFAQMPPHSPSQSQDWWDESSLVTPLNTQEAFLENPEEGRENNKKEEPLSTPLSRIESFYAGRLVDELSQYGYDLFHDRHDDDTVLPIQTPSGGVHQDSVIIGVGDTLDIILRGQLNTRESYSISPQGLLILEQFPPISVIGLTLGQLQERLSAEAKSLVNTEIFVTLKTVRQVGVTLAGHVKNPGRHVLTATHTIMDALQMAGGVKRTGTLRRIQLIRGGKTRLIDLYGLLQNGSSRVDLPLREGDKIMVPPIGATLAVAGDVKNPAIYEIPPAQTYSLATLFALSGGLISPSEYRFIKLSVNQHGQEITQDVSNLAKRQFGDGSILIVSRRTQTRKGAIEIEGHSNTQGLHDINKSRTLSALLPDRSSFGDDIYPLIGLIERWNEETLAPEYVSFSPLHIVNKQSDHALQQNDTIHLFSRKDIASLEEERGKKRDSKETEIPPLLKTILKEHAVYIRGAVRQEGAYPIHDQTALDDILSVAGGYTLEANTDKIEVTENRDGHVYRNILDLASVSHSDVLLEAGDTIRVNTKVKKLSENSIRLFGEVVSPGRYDLMPGDTLLSLIERAGGLTEHAYPEGAIFSRKSERKREESRFRAQARDLELKLSSMLEMKDTPNHEHVKTVENLIRDLRHAKAIGRITVEADPEILIAQPELNILLENDDKIYLPKRPLTVRVAGEVLSPSALQFRSEKEPRTYIDEAGGFSYHADKKRAFVIFPNGSAQPLRVNYWSHQANFVPPGSTIIVPRDPRPFNFVDSAKDITQIVANLAVTAVLAEEIGDD